MPEREQFLIGGTIMGSSTRLSILPAAIVAICCIALPTVQGCALDGVPSLRIDGRTVVLNLRPPDARTWRTYAPFVAAGPMAENRLFHFDEIRRFVSLPPEAFAHPWRWRFGDGTPAATGERVAHRFSRAGAYRIAVDAWVPTRHEWLTFDTARIEIR